MRFGSIGAIAWAGFELASALINFHDCHTAEDFISILFPEGRNRSLSAREIRLVFSSGNPSRLPTIHCAKMPLMSSSKRSEKAQRQNSVRDARDEIDASPVKVAI